MNSTVGNRHGSAVITLPSDTEILITRQFEALVGLRHIGLAGLRDRLTVPIQEIRDAILASGMEGGMQVSYNRLEDLVCQAA